MRRVLLIGGLSVGLLSLLLVVVAGVGYLDLRAAEQLGSQAAGKGEEAVRSLLRAESESAAGSLEGALDDLRAAQDRLGSPALRVLRPLPVIGPELAGIDAGVSASLDTFLAAQAVVEFMEMERPPLLQGDRVDPEMMGLLVTHLHQALDHLRQAEATLAAAPPPRTARVSGRLAQVEEASRAAIQVLEAAAGMAERLEVAAAGDDPYRVLVLIENGAELRATGGLMGFATLVELDEGRLHLERVQGITSLIRGSRGNYRPVEAPSDYVDRYGRYDANTTLWLNVNLSPHFPSVAEVARNLYLRSTDIEVSAVVRVDLVAVGYLVEALGGIEVEEERLRGPELATDFLIDSYLRFPDSDAQNEYLAGVARETFHQALTAEDRDGRAILRGLRRSVEERRLALITWLPEVDKLLNEVGADGGLLPGDPGDLELVVQNFAANKIDLFTQQIFSVDVIPSGCTVHGEVEVRLANQAPSWAIDLPAGELGITGQWWVNVHLPRAAELEALLVEGEPGVGTLEEEQGRPVVATLVVAEPGEEVTITVRWKEPIEDSSYVLTLQPQPLVRPAILELGSTEETRFANTEQHRISTGCMVEAA